MPDKKITPKELKAALIADIDRLVQQVAQAINNAQPGRIINDSEEPVRDANAEFRQRLYQKALDLLQNKQLQEDFSPSEKPTKPNLAE
jgi:TolA-binding protein